MFISYSAKDDVVDLVRSHSYLEAKSLVDKESDLFSSEAEEDRYRLIDMLRDILVAKYYREFLCSHPDSETRQTILRLLQEDEQSYPYPTYTELWKEYSKPGAEKKAKLFTANSGEIHDMSCEQQNLVTRMIQHENEQRYPELYTDQSSQDRE